MEPKIRKAMENDVNSLRALFEEGDELHRKHLPEIFRRTASPPWTPTAIICWIREEATGLFVAEADGKIVGLVLVQEWETPRFPIMKHRVFASVENIVVSGSHRGKGIGRALMERAEEWARSRGYGTVEFDVWNFDGSGEGFYQELGYEVLSRKMWKRIDP